MIVSAPKYFSIAIVILFLIGCNSEDQQIAPKTPPPLNVETVKVEKKIFPLWVQYTGTTKATSDQEIRARVSGQLEKIFFEDGADVNEGDKLFLIEQSLYQSNLDSAKAKKQKNEAALALANANVKRYQPLVKEGLAPRATLDQYEARRDELIAAIAADNATVANAKLELSYTLITAPVSGKLGARQVDVGNLVGYGESTLLTTIMQTDKIYAYFSPPEEDVKNIYQFRSHDKLPAFIEVSGQGKDLLARKRLDGFVDFSNNTVDPSTSTISMRAILENENQSIYPGTFVYVSLLVTDKFDTIMIPPAAIQEDQLGKFVYIVDSNKTAKRTSVETNLETRYLTSVSKGLRSGDEMVISGFMKIKNSIPLNPKNVTDTKGADAIIRVNNLIPSEAKK
jgi:RND family efflux transporter MFP subunit